MPKSKSSVKAQPYALHDEEVEIHNHPEESTSSDQESDAEVSFPYNPPASSTTISSNHVHALH